MSFAACHSKEAAGDAPAARDSIQKILVDITGQMLGARKDTIYGPAKWISYCADTIIANYDQDSRQTLLSVSFLRRHLSMEETVV